MTSERGHLARSFSQASTNDAGWKPALRRDYDHERGYDFSMEDVAQTIDAASPAKKRGPYKKQVA